MVFVCSGWLCDRLSITSDEAEVVALTADSPHGEFLICAVYRPPNKNIALFLDDLLAFLNKYNNKQIIFLETLLLTLLIHQKLESMTT